MQELERETIEPIFKATYMSSTSVSFANTLSEHIFSFYTVSSSVAWLYTNKNTYGRSRSCTIREGALDIEVRKWRNWIGCKMREKGRRPSRNMYQQAAREADGTSLFSQSLFSGHIRGRGVLNSKCAPHYYYCSFFIFPFLPQLFSVFFEKIRGEKNYSTWWVLSIRHLA